MRKTTLLLCIIMIPITFALGACGAVVAGGGVYGYNMFKDPQVNLRAKSYAAADYIIQQTGDFINIDTDVIKLSPLVDTDRPTMSAAFGRVIPEQVGERMRQLGYKTDMSLVMPNNAPQVINTSKRRKDYVLAGTYTLDAADMRVALKIVGAQSGQIYGTYDYTVPITEELRAQSVPQAQIYRPATQVQTPTRP